MTRPIKFRGRTANGSLVFGNYCRTVFRDIGTTHTIMDEGGEEFTVAPESVAQLVGYDAHGREVYEGDTIVVACGTELAARVFDNITPNAKLKEAPNNAHD